MSTVVTQESCLIQCKIQALGNKCHRNRAEALTDISIKGRERCSFYETGIFVEYYKYICFFILTTNVIETHKLHWFQKFILGCSH